MNVIRPSIPRPASKLGPRPSQSLSPFQLAPGTRALDTHKGAGELDPRVPTLGPVGQEGRKGTRAERQSSWERTGVQEKDREEPGEGFRKQELPGLLTSALAARCAQQGTETPADRFSQGVRSSSPTGHGARGTGDGQPSSPAQPLPS